MPKPDLDNAYALQSPEDARRFYDDWAETYESEFAREMDFILPRHVAEAFAEAGGEGPVLDFGCGTGLVGAELHARGVGPVDGIDLSPEMLETARAKGVYRELIAGNVLDGHALPAAPYGGMVSSGTLTHGHVGPDALPALLDLVAPGGRFALSINAGFYRDADFATAFDALADRIEALDLKEVRIYGDNATGPHKDDKSLVAVFRRR